nr:hypothetical protein [Enterococcus faecium]
MDQFVLTGWLAFAMFLFVFWVIYFLAVETVVLFFLDWLTAALFVSCLLGYFVRLFGEWLVALLLLAVVFSFVVAVVVAVFGFVAALVMLFLCLLFLDDLGSMASVAFVMGRLFSHFVFCGAFFIFVVVGLVCGVFGVMGIGPFGNSPDLLLLLLFAVFVGCSGMFAVLALVVGGFFPHLSLVAFSFFFVGMTGLFFCCVLLAGGLLFAGAAALFLLVLRLSDFFGLSFVLRDAFVGVICFVKTLGTIVFVSGLVVWFSSSCFFCVEPVCEALGILVFFGRMLVVVFEAVVFCFCGGLVGAIIGLFAVENFVGAFGILFCLS